MARTDNFTNFATDVADSIRSMTGKTDKIPAANFDTEIKSIETKEDLNEELNTYNAEVTEQGVSIDTIINALEGKAAGSGNNSVKPLYLIANGYDITDNTGGYTFNQTAGTVTNAVGIKQGTESLNLYTGLWAHCNITFNNAFDVSKYSYLCIDFAYPSTNVIDSMKQYIGIYAHFDTSGTRIALVEGRTTDRVTIRLPLEGVTSPQQIKISCANLSGSNGQNSSAYTEAHPLMIYNVWLEGVLSLQDKSVEITENGTTNIVADDGYYGLNSVEINTNVGGTNDNLNIFVQEDEPETKDGIWLQTNNLQYATLNLINSNDTCSWDRYELLPDTGTRECGAALVGEYIYIFAGTNNSNTHTAYAKKYNIETGVVTSITNYPISCYGILCVSYGTDIYLFGARYSGGYSSNAYKYDTLTDTYTALSNMPISVGQVGGTIIGDDVYLFGGTTANGRTANAYKYNISTDTYIQLNSLPTVRNTVAVAHIGTDVYLFGGLGESASISDAYKYDTLTDTYTKLSDVPHDGFGMGCVAYNNQIYVFGGNGSAEDDVHRDVYLYNPMTDTYIATGTTVYGVARIQSSCVINDNIIYIVGGESGTITNTSYDTLTPLCLRYIQKGTIQADDDYTNDKNALLIYCRKDGVSVNLSNTLQCKMSDIMYYSITDGLNNTIPTYYGNGTEWIKFKN